MAYLLLVLLLATVASSGAGAGGTWCVCKQGVSDVVLQKTLDYACGAGADCNPTRQSGSCFNPNTVRAHCSYAVNSYFQKNRQIPTACDFSGTATVITSDPSTTGCAYPDAASSRTTPTTTPTTSVGGIPVTATPNGGSPLVTTPTTGTGTGALGGGTNNGLGSPAGFNNNNFSGGKILLPKGIIVYSLIILSILGLRLA